MAGGITMHLVFWTGGTDPFQGQPPGAPANYVGMVKRLFTDVSHDSGGMSNIFSVLPQFAEGTALGAITPGDYSVAFNAASANDVIMDSDPYPPVADQCASPDDTAVCVTDGQVQSELDSVIASHGGHGACTTSGWCSCRPASTSASPPASAGPTSSAGITRSATSTTVPRSTPSSSIPSSRVRSRPGLTRRATRTPR